MVYRSDEALNAPLTVLRSAVHPVKSLDEQPLAPGLGFRIDPAARMTGRWQSPRGRLLELETEVEQPGDWLGLHLALPLLDLTGLGWFGFVARVAAGRAQVLRACLRSGLPGGGFHDLFFDRHILAQSAVTDHHDLIAPDHWPDLPRHALWREFVLFLPPERGIALSLHDLRLFRL